MTGDVAAARRATPASATPAPTAARASRRARGERRPARALRRARDAARAVLAAMEQARHRARRRRTCAAISAASSSASSPALEQRDPRARRPASSTSTRRSSSAMSSSRSWISRRRKRTRKTKSFSTDGRLLEELARAASDRRARDPRVPRALEAEGHLRRRAADAGRSARPAACTPRFNQAVAATGRLSSIEPEPAEHPDPHRDRAEIRARLRRRRDGLACCCRPTTRRSSCASSRTSRRSRVADRGLPHAARTSTAAPRREIFGVAPDAVTPEQRAPPRRSTSASSTA